MLFASDDDLRELQRAATKAKKEHTPSADRIRQELIDDARELRAHARTREFAWLLFVLPALIALADALLRWIVDAVMR